MILLSFSSDLFVWLFICVSFLLSLFCLFINWFNYQSNHVFFHPLIYFLILLSEYLSIYSFTYSYIHSFVYFLSYCFIYKTIHLIFCLFVRPLLLLWMWSYLLCLFVVYLCLLVCLCFFFLLRCYGIAFDKWEKKSIFFNLVFL